MRQAYYAGRSGNWESYEECQKHGRPSAWSSIKVKECHEKVETEDTGRLSIVQDIFCVTSTDLLRRSIAPVGGVGSVTCRTYAHIVVAFFLRTTFGGGHGDGNDRKKQCNWWCAACSSQYDWRAANRFLVIQDSVILEKRKFFEHTMHRKDCTIT